MLFFTHHHPCCILMGKSQSLSARTSTKPIDKPILNLLDLVDNDPIPEAGRNELAEAPRIRRQFVEKLRLQQIDIDRIGKSGSHPHGFPRPPWPEQEEALLRRESYHSGLYDSILHCNLELSKEIFRGVGRCNVCRNVDVRQPPSGFLPMPAAARKYILNGYLPLRIAPVTLSPESSWGECFTASPMQQEV